MSLIAKTKEIRIENAITPPVHLEFIQNQAAVSESDGLAEIETYHRALFLHHHATDLERYRQQARTHEERLAYLESRLKDSHSKLGAADKFIPVIHDGASDIQPSLPWNAWDGAMFLASIAGIICLLAFGVLNVSFNLLESGLVTFVENPARAYFWAALLPVGALGVKVGWDFLQNRRARSIYLWSCLFLGVTAVLAWVAAYASIYPSLSKSVAEHIQSLSVFDSGTPPTGLNDMTTGGVKWIDMITVAAQAVAEIFLSAVLGMYLTTIYGRHRPVRLAANPLFTQYNTEREELEERVASERLALAEARGNESKLENQLTALVAYARSMFHRERELRRDEGRQKQALLDQISEQLRSQLESMNPTKNGGRKGLNAAITGGNGR